MSSEAGRIRLFAEITAENAGFVQNFAHEYQEFAWNVDSLGVLDFMDDRHPNAVYAIIERLPK